LQSLPKPQLAPNALRFRKPALILASITAFGIASYSTYIYTGYRRALALDPSVEISPDPSSRYDSIASTFDSSVDLTEKLMGLSKLRRKMVQRASGDVCEVSIGTGRNLEFYDWDFPGVNGVGKIQGTQIKRGKVTSFTAVDKSAEMLEIAHEKFSTLYPGVLGVRWVVQDAVEKLPNPPRNANERSGTKVKKFDTVVQTMGLCSVGDPVGLLRNLGQSVEEGGKILLLEHGRGTWGWINEVLDGLARGHARDYGCWWNRDIGALVEESGLEIVSCERKNFGTTWMLELKPKKSVVEEVKEAIGKKNP
jgi:methyltransferase OMS1